VPDSCRGTEPPVEPASLYPRILRRDWLQLDESVRRAHLDRQKALHRSGIFRVRTGAGKMARMLIRLFGMPTSGEAIVIQLDISAVHETEVWVRRFGGKVVKTIQYATSPGVLRERFGAIELRFRLMVLDGGLRFEQIGAAVRLGSVVIPLPRFLRPSVEAYERGAESNQTHTYVAIKAPLIGLLISYEGVLDEVESK
jgi:hypothetical protein